MCVCVYTYTFIAAEAVKILKILRNPSAPMVKKRQAMRNTFGDYRKKMAEEEKKQTASESANRSNTMQHIYMAVL